MPVDSGSSRFRAVLIFSLLVFAGSFLTVAARPTLQVVTPLAFLWMQIAIGMAGLGVILLLRRKLLIPAGLTRAQLLCIAALGICNISLVRVLFLACLRRVPAPTHAYIVNFVGIVTMLLSAVWLRERPTAGQLGAAAVALGGTQLFFHDLPPSDELLGLWFGGAGVLLLACANILARQLSLLPGPRVPSLFAGWCSVLIGGVPLLVYGAITEGVPAGMRGADLLVIAGHGIVGISLGVTLWVHTLRTLRSYEASILAGTSLIYTTLLAIPMLGEVPSAYQGWAMGLMLVGLVGVQVRRT